jgi:hypothetical protein
MKMKRPDQKSKMTYREAVAMAALNDEPGVVDINEVECFISTLFIADIFGRDQVEVAQDIITIKLKETEE